MHYDIPAWLLEKNEFKDVETRAAKTHFIQKTIKHLSEVFENEFFCEKYAGKPLFLQSIDPRVKFLTIIGYMLLSSFTSSILILFILALIPLVYARLSGLAMGGYIRRVWAYIPALVLVVSLPGASNFFVKGAPLFYLLRPGFLGLGSGMYFSAGGLEMALRLALRAGISLSFGFLLLLTTRWSQLTGALASMRVPLIVISIINMAYRYIFVMSTQAGDMMGARYLRTVGRLETGDNRRFMGRSIAHLFIKSHFLSEEIYDAMCCRGFTGKPVSMTQFKIRGTDILFIVNSAVILLLLIAGERLF
jgi:cobalt ECF transporter T component CbiQ